jgi:hypothetical protein
MFSFLSTCQTNDEWHCCLNRLNRYHPTGEGALANHTLAQQAIVILEKIRQLDSLKQKMEGLRNARAA